MTVIPETITKKDFWNNEPVTYQVEDLVEFEANGGTSIDGEWEFSGSYSIRVSTGMIGNSYNYTGSLYPRYSKRKPSDPYWKTKRSGWTVHLSVNGGSSSRISVNLLNKRVTSKKKARLYIVEAIREYEQTNRFKEEIWPKVLHSDNRQPIIKEIQGEMYWIATTWQGAWTALQGRTSFHGDEKPLGYGQFYSREVNTEYKYPKKEDGSTDYDNAYKVYKEPRYRSLDVSGYGMGSGPVNEEMKPQIDAALWNMNDNLAEYIQRQRFEGLSGSLLRYGR